MNTAEDLNDYDFFGSVEGLFEDLVSEQGAASGGVRFPYTYVGLPGTYMFRLYPENHNGRTRFLRELWAHKLHNNRRVLTKREDKRLDDLISWAENEGLKDKKKGAWKYKARSDGILMAHLFKGPKDKYIHEGTTCLVLNYKQVDALKAYFRSIEANDGKLEDYLDPRKSCPAICLTIANDKDKTISMGISGGPMNPTLVELPPMSLPEGIEFTGLDNLYVKSDSFLTDEDYLAFELALKKDVSEYLAYKASLGDAHNPEEAKEKGYEIPPQTSENNLGK